MNVNCQQLYACDMILKKKGFGLQTMGASLILWMSRLILCVPVIPDLGT